MTEAYSRGGTDQAPPLDRLTALLGYHQRADIGDLESVLDEAGVRGARRSEDPSYAAGTAHCPATTAAHPAAVIGRGECGRLLAELFGDYPDYRIEHTGHRGVEHRPVRRGDRLHCDLFLDIAGRTPFGDNLSVRCVLTDDIGALVSITDERFVGRAEHRDRGPAVPAFR